jgi:hypothetical protein
MFVNVVSWILVVLLFVAGFAGCFIPMVPGTPLILLGAFVYEWVLAVPGHALGWGNLLGLTAVVCLSQVIEIFASLLGASRFGASKFGMWGAVAGLFVGLFFSLPGLILGPIAGVFLGELCSGKDYREAIRAAWGTMVGNAAGVASRVVAGALMLIWIFIALKP